MRGINMKKISNVLTTIFIIFIVLGIIGYEIGDKDDKKPKENNNVKLDKIKENKVQKETEEKRNKNEFFQDETVEYNGVEYSILRVEKNSGKDFVKPKSGYEYVVVFIKIENRSNDKISYNPLDWQMENSKGQETSYTIAGGDNDTALSSGDLNPNGYVEGSIAFEQPVGDSGLKLNYYDNILLTKSPDFQFIIGSNKVNNNVNNNVNKHNNSPKQYNNAKYDDIQLEEAAINYYCSVKAVDKIYAMVDNYEGDNVLIRLFSGGDEATSTVDWYTVNSYTGRGTDINGNSIDIMNPPSSSASNYDSGEYIFPNSDSEYLTESDLSSMSSEELRIARNEIYARYGRMFKDQALQNYFNSKSWYTPSIRPEDFNEHWLNEYEKANAKLIKSFE